MSTTKRWHPCGDTCHYSRWMPITPGAAGRRTLRLLHVCGPWCPQDDGGGPVRLGRPDPYDRAPVRQACGHFVAPGIAHACSTLATRPPLFRLGSRS